MPHQNNTSALSLRRIGLLCLAALLSIWGVGALFFTAATLKQHDMPPRADAIIVLTGDAYRIETAFRLLHDNKADALLISGVYENTSLQDLLALTSLPQDAQDALQNHCCITLDHKARSTAGNARQGAQWIADHAYENVILVTSDYHMPRAAFLFREALPAATDIYYRAVDSGQGRLDARFLRHIISEYHKTTLTYIHLTLSPSYKTSERHS